LNTDPIFCALLASVVPHLTSQARCRQLAAGGKEIEIPRVGASVYSSRKSRDGTWFVLTSGKLRVLLDKPLLGDEGTAVCEISPGEYFGGYGIDTAASIGAEHIIVDTLLPSKFVELSQVPLLEFLKEDPAGAARLMSRMAGSQFRRFIEK
jgi:hypothetical protein